MPDARNPREVTREHGVDPKAPAGCEEICESLGVYVLGVLTPEEEAPIRAHLSRCPACRSEREDLAEFVRWLRRVLPPATHSSTASHPAPAGRAVARIVERLRQRLLTGTHPTGQQTPPKKDTP